MTALELTGEVGSDHRLVVEVPDSCPPGRHRLLLLLADPIANAIEPAEGVAPTGPRLDVAAEPIDGPFAWENGVLVYTGEWLGEPIEDVVEWEREQRMREILGEIPDADSR